MAGKKIDREFITKNKVVNNYENQFLGIENDENLRYWLFDNTSFINFINPELTKEIYDKFKNENHLKYSHPISTLLTLSLFSKLISDEKV